QRLVGSSGRRGGRAGPRGGQVRAAHGGGGRLTAPAVLVRSGIDPARRRGGDWMVRAGSAPAGDGSGGDGRGRYFDRCHGISVAWPSARPVAGAVPRRAVRCDGARGAAAGNDTSSTTLGREDRRRAGPVRRHRAAVVRAGPG